MSLPLAEQIEFAKARLRGKFDGQRFIAYFQSYTGTYGDVAALESIYTQAAKREDVAALSIATRPDCLGAEVMAMLSRLAEIKPLWIELGLQTENDDTARLIRRGYPFSEYVRATQKLRDVGAHIITHVIFGLPHEDKAQMIRSAVAAGTYGDGIKLQLLHVLRGTPLAQMYAKGQVALPDAQTYYDIVASALDALPEGKVIHRMTGDGDKKILLAPLWSADKKRVINDMRRCLSERGFEIL